MRMSRAARSTCARRTRGSVTAHPRRILAFLPPPSGFFDRRPNASSGGDAERCLPRPGRDRRRRRRPDRASQPDALAGRRHRQRQPGHRRDAGHLALRGPVVRAAGALSSRPASSSSAARSSRRSPGAADLGLPVLTMTDCLAGQASARDGLARLVGVTVLGRTAVRTIEASDCLFAGPIAAVPAGTGAAGRRLCPLFPDRARPATGRPALLPDHDRGAGILRGGVRGASFGRAGTGEPRLDPRRRRGRGRTRRVRPCPPRRDPHGDPDQARRLPAGRPRGRPDTRRPADGAAPWRLSPGHGGDAMKRRSAVSAPRCTRPGRACTISRAG